MKKGLKLFVSLLLVSVIFVGKVSASDLTSKITADDGLGGLTTFTKSYDATNDVNNLKVSLVVNEESINQILSQKPGVGGSLGTFYISISPNTGNVPVYKENFYYYYSDPKTVDEIKADLNARIDEDDKSNHETVWPIGVVIQYYDSTSSSWKSAAADGDGVTTCKQNLMSKLAISDENELKYGVNFRFIMYNNLDWWMVWSDKNPNTDTPTKVEYIKVSYEILFPIKSSNGTESVFHASLKDAIERGYDEITINKDIAIDENITLPSDKSLIISEDVTLTINEGATLTLEEGATLDGEGYIEKNGKLMIGNTEVFFINIIDSENGTVSVNSEVAPSGEEMTITVNPKNGYELKTLKVVDLSTGKEIKVTNGKFTMPSSDVEISATFAEKTEVLPPKTSDINLPLILGIIMLAVVGAALALRKRLAKVK